MTDRHKPRRDYMRRLMWAKRHVDNIECMHGKHGTVDCEDCRKLSKDFWAEMEAGIDALQG